MFISNHYNSLLMPLLNLFIKWCSLLQNVLQVKGVESFLLQLFGEKLKMKNISLRRAVLYLKHQS